jgi:oxygen-dependent protoporphyrinogen oxidase
VPATSGVKRSNACPTDGRRHLHADPETLSLARDAAAVPRHGSGTSQSYPRDDAQEVDSAGTMRARYSLFLSFDRGMEVLRKCSCRAYGLERPAKHTVEEQRMTPEPGNKNGLRRSTVEADAVCLAVTGLRRRQLIRNRTSATCIPTHAITYASTATINFAYRRAAIAHPLNGFGFVVPFIEKRSLLACTFSRREISRPRPGRSRPSPRVCRRRG